VFLKQDLLMLRGTARLTDGARAECDDMSRARRLARPVGFGGGAARDESAAPFGYCRNFAYPASNIYIADCFDGYREKSHPGEDRVANRFEDGIILARLCSRNKFS
jgi:hypothetical protein